MTFREATRPCRHVPLQDQWTERCLGRAELVREIKPEEMNVPIRNKRWCAGNSGCVGRDEPCAGCYSLLIAAGA